MSIRSATQEDVTDIAELVHSLAHFYLQGPEDQLPSWLAETLTLSSFSLRISSADYLNWVYQHDKKIIGYLALKDSSHLYHLFVSEQHQGQGIARELWNTAKQASPAEYYTVRSSVFAVPVYRRLGFVETGPLGIKDGIAFQPMACKCG